MFANGSFCFTWNDLNFDLIPIYCFFSVKTLRENRFQLSSIMKDIFMMSFWVKAVARFPGGNLWDGLLVVSQQMDEGYLHDSAHFPYPMILATVT